MPASTSAPPKLSMKLPRFTSNAFSSIVRRILRTPGRATGGRDPAVRGAARCARAGRSQAAQHMSAEDVCTRSRVRSSHMLASGVA
jgi:hypothetical protein